MPEKKRHRLDDMIDQVRYMLEEIDALRPLIDRIPEDVLDARPLPGDRSVKEWYGTIITAQEAYTPEGKASEGGGEAGVDVDRILTGRVAEDWNAYSMAEILRRLVEGRQRLVARIEDRKEDASGGVMEVTRAVLHVDRECQRQIGARLFEMRPPPSPITRQV